MPRPTNTLARRAQITRGLLHVMARQGYDGAAITDVAAAAGLSAGLVHYHFKSKLDILLTLLDDLAAQQGARLDERLAAAAGDPSRELAAFIDAHLDHGAGANPDALACWVALGGEALREVRVRRAYACVIVDAAARLTEILRRGVERGAFECVEPEASAAAILAVIQGYFALSATARGVIPLGSAAWSVHRMAEGLVRPVPAPAAEPAGGHPAAPRRRRSAAR